MFLYSLCALFAGMLLDCLLGDPDTPLHPIRLTGRLIEKCEIFLRLIFKPDKKSMRLAGMLLAVTVCLCVTGAAFAVISLSYALHTLCGICSEAVLCWLFLAARSLCTESMRVYDRLASDDIEGARQAVARIVGRDTENLDADGIARAAVETVAENLSDGVIAPMFYMLLGGAAAGAFYKAVNTLDSMVGYKNEKYIDFGFFSAKLDDAVNFLPSRISALAMTAAAFILGYDFKNAARIFKRDRYKHPSPNSAQTESVCAGALGIRLAGDNYYFGRLYKKPYIGDGIRQIQAEDIRRANRLMYVSAAVCALLFGLFKLAFVLLWRRFM